MTRISIRVLPQDMRIEADEGQDLKTALAAGGVALRGSCRGTGVCGECRVRVGSGWVNACAYKLLADVTVYIPERSLVPSEDTVGSGATVERRPQAGPMALAVDIGTTTLSIALLSGGDVVFTGTRFNPQIAFGDDVISRIIHCEDEKDGLTELRQAVVSGLNSMLASSGIPTWTCVNRVVIAGNTTMSHIFCGRDPSPIRREGLPPEALAGRRMTGEESMLQVRSDAVVDIVAAAGSFVGGDIVAGVIASGLHESQDLSLLVDIGTNGELVLGNKEWMVACACSAGPAFEGGGMTWGMPARAGAVYDVTIENGRSHPLALGDVAPEGICGSGIISAVAAMLEAGIIDRSARLLNGIEAFPIAVSRHLGTIALYQADLANVLRAKAAMFAGIRTLASSVGVNIEDISRVFVAGGFGNSLNLGSAVKIGLLPDLPEARYTFVGNSSLSGAIGCLADRDGTKTTQGVAGIITYLDLAQERRFMDEYVAAMFLPHTDMSLFGRRHIHGNSD